MGGIGPLSNGELGSGLMGHYYSIPGDGIPDGRMMSTSGILAMIAQYGGGTPVKPFGNPIATDTSAFTTFNTNGQNNTNGNGATFNYGTGSTGNTRTSGFPLVVRTTNSGGNSVFGVWTGIFFAPVAGTYEFDCPSDDNSSLFIDSNLLLFQFGSATRVGSVNLSAGAHAIEIAWENGGGGYGLWADVQLPGTTAFQRLPNSLMGTIPPTLLQIGALSGSGTVNLGVTNGVNNQIAVGSDNHSTTFSGTINAPGSTIANFPNLVKSGAGTLVLPTGETYTGQTAINGGVLQVGTPTTTIAALATSAIINSGNLSLVLPNSSSFAYNGVISGTGGVTIQGQSDIITLGGANTYTGPTLVGGNTIKQGVANAFSAFSLAILGQLLPGQPGTLDLNNFNGSIGPVTSLAPFGSVVTNSGASTVNLTLNGTGATTNVNVPITGKLNLMVTGSGTEILSAANTYTGSTTITGSTLIAGGNSALPGGTALTVSGTGVLDLHGNSLTVSSLSGASPSGTITDSTATPSTLTISNTSSLQQSFSYAGAVTGPLSLVNATGSNTLTVLTNGVLSSFYGGVTTSSGAVAGLPGSLGTGAVTLSGGTAELVGGQQVVGFGNSGVGWTVNKNATAAGITGAGGFGNFGSVLPAINTWQATTANNLEATDLIYNTPVQPNNGFTASFIYLDNSPGSTSPANGVTFMLEADPLGPFALGGTGGALGYGSGGSGSNANGSIRSSMAIALNLYTGAAGGLGTSLQTNGAISTCVDPGQLIGPMLISGHPVNVVLQYNAADQVLVETFTDTVTGVSSFVDFYGLNLFSVLGSANAFIGFTGGTGGVNAAQLISNFTYLGASGAATAFTNPIQATSGATSSLTVQANNLANAYSTSGNLTVPAGATVNVGPDATSTANQAYGLAIGGTTTLGGSVNIANNGTGTGTLILNGAVQGVGASNASIGGGGSVTLGALSAYKVVLGGASPGSYTDLTVGGGLNLAGGSLSLAYAGNFAPAANQSFTILQSSGPLTGAFAQGSTITAGNITYAISYTTSSVVLTAQTIVAPTELTFLTVPSTATAGTPVSFTLAATDASGEVAGGDSSIISLSSSGGAISPTQVTLVNGVATVPITFTTAGLQTLTAHDLSESITDAATPVTVNPGVFDHFKLTLLTTNPAGPGTQAAGNPFLIVVQAVDIEGNAVSSYSGPASMTITTSPIDPRSPSFPLTIPIDSSGRGYGLGALETAGSYTLSATVGSFTTPNAGVVTVFPAEPARLGFVAQPANTPTGVKLPAVSVAIQDLFGNTITSDNSDAVTLSVASGPGPFLAGSTLTATAVNGVATFTNLTLVVPGTYTLAAIVPGKFTGPNSNGFSIAPLQVLSLAGSATGFTAAFNAPFLVNSTTPVLFGSGFGASAPVPSVTLTGPSGPVEGSVLLNSATNSLTFLETNTASMLNSSTPLLPDGTYTAVIHGTPADDGFQALNPGGGYLGGSTPHDFTQTFTVSSGTADVVWVPDTADGPKQTLQAPGNNVVGAAAPFVDGFPVYLNDFTAQVSSVTLTFNYNPAMLSVTGVSPSPGLPGSSFTLDTAFSTPGHAVLTYADSGANAGNLTIGSAQSAIAGVPLGLIHAVVPSSSVAVPVYKGKDLLHLSGITINGGSINAVGGDGLHLVAYVGDADGNGIYTSNDAVLITRAALQSDSGFTAYPLVDPVVVADTDGSGFIPADAPLEVNEQSVGVMPQHIVYPGPLSPSDTTPIGNNVDPALSISTSPSGTVAVNLDDAHPAGSTGLIRGVVALSFDPRQISVSPADVHAGSLLAGGNWTVSPSIDQAAGQIIVYLSSDTPITSSQGGSLVTIDFRPLVGRIANPSSISLVPLGTELQDTAGMFTLNLASATLRD
jgi:autotransporter-associated beta strand protein